MSWALPLGVGIMIGYIIAYIGLILDKSCDDKKEDDAPPSR